MRALLFALGLLGTEIAVAAPRPRAAASELRLVFLEGDATSPLAAAGAGDARMDVGRIVARCTKRPCMRTVVRKRFRIRVDGGSGTGRRFVYLRASVATDSPDQRLSIDGRRITTSPQLVGAAVPVGVATTHTLELEVSVTAPPGLVAADIDWLVEDAR